jgi:uncharacterized protein (TIGR02217 family)
MSNALFPKLAGLTFDISATPTWSTVVQRSKNGSTTRLMSDPYPQWAFDLSYEFLRDAPPQRPGGALNPSGYTELEQIVGFYNARGGSFDDFLLDPGLLTGRPREWEVHGGPVGIGDGTTTTFYLQRDCGGFVDEVQNPAGNPLLAVNGIAVTSGWSLGAAGAITFATAPANNAVITWNGRWMWRVRFAEDTLDLKQFMYQLYELQSLKLEQVKL